MFAFAVTALALAACGGYNINNLYGTPAPTATAGTPTPNPVISAAVVLVMVSNSPLPNQSVSVSTDVNGSTGSLIATQLTDSTGTTTFTGLTPATAYCFTSSYAPPALPTQSYSQCNYLWFNGVTINFSN